MVCALIVSAVCLFGCNRAVLDYPGDIIPDETLVRDSIDGVTRFTTLDELNAALNVQTTDWRYGRYYLYSSPIAKNGVLDYAVEYSDSAPAPTTGSAPDDHSTTNVQTEGVDEGDIVKTDGEYIYCLNTSGFNIVRAQRGDMELTYKLDIDNYYPIEMYSDGNTLVLIGGIYEPFDYLSIDGDYIYYRCMPYYYYNRKTDIRVFDISDKTAPVELRHVTVDGYYNTSRMTDGQLYYIVDYSFSRYYRYSDNDPRPNYSYSAKINGADQKLPLGNIYKIGDNDSYSFTIVGKMNISDGAVSENKLNGYIGANGELYASEKYLYLVGTEYENSRVKNEEQKVIVSTSVSRTAITKIAMSDLSIVARASVMGSINDRFSLDEYQNNLRVATTTDKYTYSYYYGKNEDDYVYSGDSDSYRVNRVYVLDADLKQIGLIDEIAVGEKIYSCRFNGAKGSLVTFENIDPYYNLDLSDPTNPKISKGLKEDGVSHYIHYLGDSGYTIGVGVDTHVNQYGNAVSGGVKISMYDNRSGEAVNVQTYILGDYGYTPLSDESRALLYDERLGLFAFPVSYYTDNYNASKQGLAVFRFNTEQGTLEYRGLLSNMSDDGYEYYWYYYIDTISRGIRIGDYIYTVSDSRIVSYDWETLTEYAKIVFDAVEDENAQ